MKVMLTAALIDSQNLFRALQYIAGTKYSIACIYKLTAWDTLPLRSSSTACLTMEV